jgi:CRP-like cAMP-binding protein
MPAVEGVGHVKIEAALRQTLGVSREGGQTEGKKHDVAAVRRLAMLVPGDFFGEGVLAGQSVRIGTATAIAASSVLTIDKEAIVRLIHEQTAFADRFLSYMLQRNIRIEADPVD